MNLIILFISHHFPISVQTMLSIELSKDITIIKKDVLSTFHIIFSKYKVNKYLLKNAVY